MSKKGIIKPLELTDQRPLEAAQGWFWLATVSTAKDMVNVKDTSATISSGRPYRTWQ
jgi:hypothetical protein